MTFRSRLYTTGALAAVMSGARRVLRAPLLLVAIYLLTIVTVVPFAIVLGTRLQTTLASQQVTHDPAHALDADIDAEWWFEFIRHASGLEATFTPAIIGAAAPLTAANAVLDGEVPAAGLLLPLAGYAALWAFLWGGILPRLREDSAGARAFFANATRSFVPMLVLTVLAATIYILLYATVHALLFGPLVDAVRASSGSELTALLWRTLFYLLFGTCLIAVNLAVDYTRVFAVVGHTSVMTAAREAFAFLRARLASAAGAYLLLGVVFVLMLAVYTVIDVYGGSRVGGWRAVILGQAFIIVRLALRLTFAATALELARSVLPDHRSRVDPNPGPPAAT
jgi:hypothetical protein